MKVAVVGCGHGELDRIYESIKLVEERDAVSVDLLLVCGDFQAVRNREDLLAMACPPKYRSLNTFYKYYSGEKVAPVTTVFVGGNHEASDYLLELLHGGWVAPNIYFMGFAGIVRFGELRIAGLSGIYKRYSYRMGHHEHSPLSPDDVRSVYHVREYDVLRLLQVQDPIDIFLSHDWPVGITKFGNEAALCRRKTHFRDDIAANELGSPPAWELLEAKRPRYWFSAHLHVKFAAVVPWESVNVGADSGSGFGSLSRKRGRVADGDADVEIGAGLDLGATEKDVEKKADQKAKMPHSTRFLALDKVLPGRDFLHVIDIESVTEAGAGAEAEAAPLRLEYDCEWLAILRSTMAAWPHSKHVGPGQFASILRGEHVPTTESIQWIRNRLMTTNHSLAIPTDDFTRTAPAHGQGQGHGHGQGLVNGANPQTYALMVLLDDVPPPPKEKAADKTVSTSVSASAEAGAEAEVEAKSRSRLALPPPMAMAPSAFGDPARASTAEAEAEAASGRSRLLLPPPKISAAEAGAGAGTGGRRKLMLPPPKM